VALCTLRVRPKKITLFAAQKRLIHHGKYPSSNRTQGNAPLSRNPSVAHILRQPDHDKSKFLPKHPFNMKRYLDARMIAASLPPQTEARHATLQAA
jgi:hypothetical protein